MKAKRVIEVLDECIDKLATWRDWGRLSRNWDEKVDEAYYADRIQALAIAVVAVKHYAEAAAEMKSARKETKK